MVGNDTTQFPHNDNPSTGMFGFHDAVFSLFVCDLCIVITVIPTVGTVTTII